MEEWLTAFQDTIERRADTVAPPLKAEEGKEAQDEIIVIVLNLIHS